MAELTIRPATPEDALSLAPRLREADRMELIAGGSEDLAKALLESIEFSDESFVALEHGKVIALWGFGLGDHPGLGVPWLLGSPELVRYGIKLVSLAKADVARWEKLCPVMSNFTHADNHVHHRWLERIGFSFVPGTFPMGDHGAPFRQFYRHSKNV